MKIVYNPRNGAPIDSFIFGGVMIDLFYPDGYEISSKEISRGLMQFEDDYAYALVDNYPFLTIKSPEEAKVIAERNPEISCDFPGCEFKTMTNQGLKAHQRKHAKESDTTSSPAIDPALIPISRGKRVSTIAQKERMSDNEDDEIPNGNSRDSDGVEWYGEGATVQNKEFGPMKKKGQGHF